MGSQPLYSIGHGSRKAEDFLTLLQQYGILYLADVRSKPYSRFHPQFNKNKLESFLKEYHITYVFMGDELGGRPEDPSVYNDKGSIDYDLLKEKEFYQQGIERLKTAYAKGLPVAIMCSERDPCMCHRTKLVGKTLYEQGIELIHINEKGQLVGQASLECLKPSRQLTLDKKK
jgi:uncharacterized protein (DUF488 family)